MDEVFSLPLGGNLKHHLSFALPGQTNKRGEVLIIKLVPHLLILFDVKIAREQQKKSSKKHKKNRNNNDKMPKSKKVHNKKIDC